MYKIKIVYLSKTSEGTPLWAEQWVDWDGIEETDPILEAYFRKEKNALRGIDRNLQYALIAETRDITDGKFQCGSCDCFFDDDSEQCCPFCGSGNYVEGCIDEEK